MALNEGRLRHRGRHERWTEARDSSGTIIQDPITGEPQGGWMSLGYMWMAVEPLSAREFMQSAAIQSDVTARIVMRYREVNAKDRIIHVRRNQPDVVYNVAGALEDKDSGQEYITLACSRGVNEG